MLEHEGMKVLDLISKLEEMHTKYGDVEVYASQGRWLSWIKDVDWDDLQDGEGRIIVIEVEND